MSLCPSKVSIVACAAMSSPTMAGHIAMIDPMRVGVSHWLRRIIRFRTLPRLEARRYWVRIGAIPGFLRHWSGRVASAARRAPRSPSGSASASGAAPARP